MSETKKTFGNLENGEATVRIRNIKGGRVAVVAYLPAGIDLTPMVYGRFENEAAALPTFEHACNEVERMVNY